MPTTKPLRRRPNRPAPARRAPTYARLRADAYAALDPLEQARHDAHVDIDAAFDAQPFAATDHDAYGWPEGCRLADRVSGSADEGALNAVEAWSQRPDTGGEWLAEFAELRGLLVRVARLARFHFGFDPERGRPETARPAQRGNTVEVCVWCGEPAPAGRDEAGRLLVRRVDGSPVHASPCYWTASREARSAGVSVASLVAGRKAAPR